MFSNMNATITEQVETLKLLQQNVESNLNFGQPTDFGDNLLAIWIIMGGLYYLPTSTEEVCVRIVPKAIIHSNSTYNLELLNFLLNCSDCKDFNKDMISLFRMRIMSAYPNELYSEYKTKNSQKNTMFRLSAPYLFSTVMNERFIGAPPIHSDYLNYINLANKNTILQKEEVINQKLPKGIELNDRTNGGTSYFLKRDDNNYLDEYLPPYYPFWNINAKLYEYINSIVDWCLLLCNNNGECKNIIELSKFFFAYSCNAYGPSLTIFKKNKECEEFKKNYILLSLLNDAKPGSHNLYRKQTKTQREIRYEFSLQNHELNNMRWIYIFNSFGAQHLLFRELYSHIRKIGSGSFSNVYKCINSITGDVQVIKSVEKSRLHQANGFTEIQVLTALSHPSIIHINGAFYNETTVIIVTEYLDGGDIYEYIKSNSFYSEAMAKEAMKKILSALVCLNSKKIIHRDLKSENIMLKDNNDPTSVCLIDFGLSSHLGSKYMDMRCGSPGFVAPEVLLDKLPYDTKADIFSVGAIFYCMITGKRAFTGENSKAILKNNSECVVKFYNKQLKNLSQECKSLLGWLLQRNPYMRCTAAQALSHPFFHSNCLLDGPPVDSNSEQFLIRIPYYAKKFYSNMLSNNTYNNIKPNYSNYMHMIEQNQDIEHN